MSFSLSKSAISCGLAAAMLWGVSPAHASLGESGGRPRGDNLILASQQGMGIMVRTMLASGVNVNVTDWRGYTALIAASKLGHANVVAMLLDHGATVDAAERSGYTALAWAVRQGRVEVVDLLLARGADPDQDIGRGMTPLELAKGMRRQDLVDRLSQRARPAGKQRPAAVPVRYAPAAEGIWSEDRRRTELGVVVNAAGLSEVGVVTEDAPARSNVTPEERMPHAVR